MPSIERKNFCVQPNFELENSWIPHSESAQETLERQTSETHDGTYALKVTTSGFEENEGIETGEEHFVPSLSASEITVSAWVKVPKGVDINLIAQERSGGSWVSNLFGETEGTGDWQRLRETFTLGAGADALSCIFYLYGTGAEVFYIDSILVESGSELLPYFDGATAPVGYTTSWEGTANDSMSVAVQTEEATGSSPYEEEVLADSPVGYWRLGEASGTTAADSSGNGNDGEYNGVEKGVPGAIADGTTSARFNRRYVDFISVPNAEDLQVGDTFTIEAWYKDPGIANGLGVIGKGDGEFSLRINYDGTGRYLTLLSRNAKELAYNLGYLPEDTDWHHIVATKNGEARHIYIDGVDETELNANATCEVTEDPIWIGSQAFESSERFDGVLDEVALYPTALSAERVKAHFDAASVEPPQITYESPTEIGESGATIHATLNTVGAGDIHGEVSGLVSWGTTTSYGSGKEFSLSEGTAEKLSLKITGLTAGTTYHYRIALDNGETGADQTFTTKEAPPVNTSLPVITGTPKVGQTLTCSTGVWTGAESYTYQWQGYVVSLEKWKSITGATSATYTPDESLGGQKVRCVVTATNEVGSTEATSEAVTVEEATIVELKAAGTGTGTGAAKLLRSRSLKAAGTGTGSGVAKLSATRLLRASGTGSGSGTGSLTVVRPNPPRRNRKPPLDLDVEVETTAGTFRLASDDPKASNRPSNMSFSTSRGNGFANGSVQLNRQIFRDYPDVNLLDTWRFVGRQGDIAYEARLHSDPRTNSPSPTLNVELVGWMSYLKSRKVSPLIIDRRVDGWHGPSNSRRGYMIGLGFRWEAEPQAGWQGEGTTGPGVVFTFTTLNASYTELGEAWLYGGGESIGALRYDYKSMSGSADATWATAGFLFADDVEGPYVAGTDTNKTTVANQEVGTGEVNAKYALLQEAYGGSSAGTVNEVHAFINPRIIGTHALTARGESPTEGYYVSDIIKYVLNTYYPKINTEHVKENQFAIQQATWAESPVYGSELIAQLNDLTLWEENVWENRSYHYEPADLTKTDWQIRTDEPGVVVNFQGESIENFANGVVVTYQDFSGIRRVLYPDQHPELLDPSPNNAATEHGEDLWTDVEVRWPCLEAEALQYGRAYLAEFNRPKRPGTFTINTGYVKDGAGHWQQGWKVRNSQTLSVMDHPSESAPRLITATSWDDDSKSLSITVDAPPSTIDAVVARTVLALGAHNLS